MCLCRNFGSIFKIYGGSDFFGLFLFLDILSTLASFSFPPIHITFNGEDVGSKEVTVKWWLKGRRWISKRYRVTCFTLSVILAKGIEENSGKNNKINYARPVDDKFRQFMRSVIRILFPLMTLTLVVFHIMRGVARLSASYYFTNTY